MNCNEFNQCVCEVIDKRLSAERTQELLDHATLCPHCKYEYESLKAAKNIVHSKVLHKSVPTEVYYSIKASINSPKQFWLKSFLGLSMNPVIAFVVLLLFALGVYSLFLPSPPPMSDDANIISQSLKNYQAVIGGSIKPAMVDDEDNVRTYLEKEVSFTVNVPKMPGCSWCGGVLSSFKGTKLAHVVYGLGDQKVVYLYQANMAEVMEGKTIGLPKEAKADLERTNWYVKEFPDSTTIVLWKYENTLCAAVSKMDKEHLIALFTEKKEWKEE